MPPMNRSRAAPASTAPSASPAEPISQPPQKQHIAANMAARGPLRSTQVPKIAADTPEDDDADGERQRAQGAGDAERTFQRVLEDAPGVGRADRQVDRQRCGWHQPTAPPGRGDDAVPAEKKRRGPRIGACSHSSPFIRRRARCGGRHGAYPRRTIAKKQREIETFHRQCTAGGQRASVCYAMARPHPYPHQIRVTID